MGDHEIQRYATVFPYDLILLDEGLKYLGFRIKPNQYKKEDWTWVLEKIEKGQMYGATDGFLEQEY